MTKTWHNFRKIAATGLAAVCIFAGCRPGTGESKDTSSKLQSVSSDEQTEESNSSAASVSDSAAAWASKEACTAYLTFDDGPSAMTPKILDTLKEYHVKATFFVVHKSGSVMEAYLKRAYEEGHEIAVHSYTHNYKQVYQSVDSFIEDFEKTRQWIQNATGAPEPTLQYRFPGGSSISKKLADKAVINQILFRMGEMKAVHHDWNVSSGDGGKIKPKKEQILYNVMQTAVKYKEPVILLHDSLNNVSSYEALPELIEALRKEGYGFDTVSHIQQPAQHKVYSASGVPASSEHYLLRKKKADTSSLLSSVVSGSNALLSSHLTDKGQVHS